MPFTSSTPSWRAVFVTLLPASLPNTTEKASTRGDSDGGGGLTTTSRSYDAASSCAALEARG